MNSGILWATLSAISFGFWIVLENQAANKIDNLFGAIMVSLTAVLLGFIILIPKIRTKTLIQNNTGLLLVILAGICALAIDYFALKAYSKGVPTTIGGPIIIGGSITTAAIIGFLLGDEITITKIIGILLVIGGASILSI